jgi:hypothetical protein
VPSSGATEHTVGEPDPNDGSRVDLSRLIAQLRVTRNADSGARVRQAGLVQQGAVEHGDGSPGEVDALAVDRGANEAGACGRLQASEVVLAKAC